MQSQKRQNGLSFQGKSFYITVIQVYATTSNSEEADVERFYEDLQGLLELTPQKDVLFIIRDWNVKVGSQEIPGVTGKFGLGVQNDAGQRLIRVLPREHTGHSKHPLQQLLVMRQEATWFFYSCTGRGLLRLPTQ